MTTVIDVGGVDIRSAAILQRECSFPITNLGRRCKRDQVFQAMPIWFGGWEDGVKAPAITGTNYTVDTTNSVGNACKSPVVRASLEACELLAPNMRCIKLSTDVLMWKDLLTRYCRQRSLARNGVRIFDNNGNLDFGQPYTLDILKMALAAVWDVLGMTLVDSALAGDAGSLNQFDGLYNQLENGWQPADANPCPDEFNMEQVIDWNALTGGLVGGTASPDKCTVAGKTVTIWGEIFDVPEGINLAEFIDDLWIEKIDAEGICKGSVDQWEIHTAWGQAKCLQNTTACMKPCSSCDDDPEARARLADFRRNSIVEFYPSGTMVPVMQSRSMPANTIRFGPRTIDGEYTYGLFIDDIDKYLSMLPTNPFNRFTLSQTDVMEHSFLCREDWRAEIEERGIYWNLHPTSSTCVEGEVQLCAGVLATSRHLWLRVENVGCASVVGDCDTEIEVI